MKILKNTLLAISTAILMLISVHACGEAWDNTMTDEEIMYYLEKYPTEEKLIKLAEKRNLIEN